VDRTLIDELKQAAENYKGKNLRICLHPGPDAVFHSMIILERKGNYYPPHKHLEKGESWHIIEGTMGAFVFDEGGDIIDACRLDADGAFIYRVDVNAYHAVLPLTDYVIYHESKPGPFLGPQESIFPSWAPDPGDGPAVNGFVARLLNALKAPGVGG
jgi:glucose-6-phosphate isomerase